VRARIFCLPMSDTFTDGQLQQLRQLLHLELAEYETRSPSARQPSVPQPTVHLPSEASTLESTLSTLAAHLAGDSSSDTKIVERGWRKETLERRRLLLALSHETVPSATQLTHLSLAREKLSPSQLVDVNVLLLIEQCLRSNDPQHAHALVKERLSEVLRLISPTATATTQKLVKSQIFARHLDSHASPSTFVDPESLRNAPPSSYSAAREEWTTDASWLSPVGLPTPAKGNLFSPSCPEHVLVHESVPSTTDSPCNFQQVTNDVASTGKLPLLRSFAFLRDYLSAFVPDHLRSAYSQLAEGTWISVVVRDAMDIKSTGIGKVAVVPESGRILVSYCSLNGTPQTKPRNFDLPVDGFTLDSLEVLATDSVPANLRELLDAKPKPKRTAAKRGPTGPVIESPLPSPQTHPGGTQLATPMPSSAAPSPNEPLAEPIVDPPRQLAQQLPTPSDRPAAPPNPAYETHNDLRAMFPRDKKGW